MQADLNSALEYKMAVYLHSAHDLTNLRNMPMCKASTSTAAAAGMSPLHIGAHIYHTTGRAMAVGHVHTSSVALSGLICPAAAGVLFWGKRGGCAD